ncbi:MAG: tetratricopeptide repeat protein [Candidatus Brocadiaceae bacterium]|nr:tetratricopeptide repeat protein [Candidatus Brocadiaceae bacterium]
MINASSKELFQEAHGLHQLGKLTEAAELYNNILKEQPDNINVIFLAGTLNLQQRNFEVACTFFRKVLELNPDYAMVHCNLGIALHESGRIDEAIKCYRKAITLKPNHVDTYFNLGNTLKQQGKLEDAVICYKSAIELNPNDANLYCNLGNTCREHGKLLEAIECYRQASELNPDNAGFHCNLGAALQKSGSLDEAILSYKEAVRLDPDYAMAYSNLGSVLQESGKLNEAIANYERAIEKNPDYAEAYNNLGISLLEKGEPEEAITCHKKAIELKPDCADTYNNLGTAFMEQGKLDDAITSYKKALLLKTEYAEAYNNLGTALMKQGKFDAAIISHKKAIGLKPDYAEAYNNLGTVLKESSKPLDAIASYKYATELNPDYAQAHLNTAFAFLLTENFKKGWQEYEWRLHLKGCTSKTSREPMWDGSSLDGKSILIYTEQGLGDAIQFIRYLPMVKAQGGFVIVECQKSLCHLLRNCDGIDEIVEIESNRKSLKQPDIRVPLLSLPGIFDITMDSIKPNKSYIKPEPGLVSRWQRKLDNDKNFKVGIVWAGNPNHKNDKNRSCTLKDFAHLSTIPGLTLYSLQKGQNSAEADNPSNGMNIINLNNELNDFSDTAAAIVNLDLVITVDTSVAHLAGAIGKPVWTLLPFVPDWRWFLNRSDSPWYPSMRLFRQNKQYDLRGVFDQVKKALTQEISDFEIRIADCEKNNLDSAFLQL